MKTASWVILLVAGALTLIGSLISAGVAYTSVVDDRIGPATLTELSAGRPDVATAVRARRGTAAAYGAGFEFPSSASIWGRQQPTPAQARPLRLSFS
jgi:hypothetical protein